MNLPAISSTEGYHTIIGSVGGCVCVPYGVTTPPPTETHIVPIGRQEGCGVEAFAEAW